MTARRQRRSGRRLRLAGARLVASLALAATAGCRNDPVRPDVVVITIDTLRADRVGRTPTLTPNIDALAAKSTVFDRAVTPMGTTFPAHATLFTGLHPREHGVRWNGASLAEKFVTLAETFRERGYATAAFVSFHIMARRHSIGQGFDARVDPGPGHRVILPADVVNQQAIAWLRDRGASPLFLWVHYYEPHSPYRLTPWAAQRMGDYSGPYRWGASVEALEAYNRRPALRTAENRRALNLLYDGEVVEADRAVGELLAALEDRPTVIVVTADHGQLLSEHGRVGHGALTWEEVLRIPLVIHDSTRPVGRRVSTRVGLIDLAPTLLDLAGVPFTGPMRGRSLAPALAGASLPETHYFAEIRRRSPKKNRTDRLAIAREDRKLRLRNRGCGVASTWRAYDLVNDPGELAPETPGERDRELQRLLEEYCRIIGPAPEGAAEVDDERLEALRALGYVE